MKMNIFYLGNAKLSAKELCDKHIVKMVLESAQMLCTTHWCFANTLEKVQELSKIALYKPAHVNHPSTIWTRRSNEQYMWHYDLYCEMSKEYTRRYGKIHGASRFIGVLDKPPKDLGTGFTEPPQCMPDKYKNDCTVTAYRNYYIAEKKHFAKYKKGGRPEWL
tara:strand:- start:501 stop:989 length:489 start_codon:yes stop_codon:yes gene_type:complete